MDRKRKATSTDTSASTKKIKLVNTRDVPSPAQTPSANRASQIETVGLQLVNNLRKSQDKSGRLIASQFLSLPPQDELPDYYEIIKLPLAIDTIEDKINNGEYSSITAIESDFKRMVQNAKDYNNPNSEIYQDAERIRKLVYNYMKQHNPRYEEDSAYASFPTPIPESRERKTNGATPGHGANGRTSTTPARQAKSKATSSSEPPNRRTSVAAEPTNGDEDEHESGVSFSGLSFQDAQFAIIDALLKYTDEEGVEIFSPFANLPSRSLVDYYKVIKYPVCLRKVRKRVDGEHGRNERTGITDFKTWDAFANEVSFIWRNAKDYNEDGSEMFELAVQFEEHFKSLLEEAKSKVSPPTQPNTKIKIGGPKPKVTLNLSQNRPSPSPATVSVDNEALKRQRQSVSAAANGQQAEQPQSSAVNGTQRAVSQTPATTEQARPQSRSAAAAGSPAEPVKLEKAVSQSPAVNPAVPAAPAAAAATTVPVASTANTNTAAVATGSMPPPSVRPTSSSPFPTGPPAVNSYAFTAPALLPPAPIRTYPLAEALLPKVKIASHPHLQLPKPLSLGVPPHTTLTQQSRTITLPASHYYLQISPTISKSLSFGRPYKMFVTVNNIRLTQRDTQQDGFLRTHVYEASLVQGVNRIEIEVAASRDHGKEGLDVEKTTVFANLMKS